MGDLSFYTVVVLERIELVSRLLSNSSNMLDMQTAFLLINNLAAENIEIINNSQTDINIFN